MPDRPNANAVNEPALKAIVIGGGPAGLMAAEVLATGGAQVDLYDAMRSEERRVGKECA